MPLGAARITLLAFQPSVQAAAEVIRRKVGVTAVGNAQIDTAQSKFGGASALFDGTGDYLICREIDFSPYATSDWTVEGWIRTNSLSTVQNIWSIGARSNGFAFCRLILQTDGDILLLIANSTPNGELVNITTTNGPISVNTWYHIAVVRNGSNFTVYLNGSSVVSATNSGAVYTGDSVSYLGSRLAGGNFGLFQNGYTDEVRISNFARYTATFTPSTTPFVNDEDTLLLLHMDGTDGSTDFLDDNGVRGRVGVTAIGNAQIDTAQSKFGGASLSVSSTGDYLNVVDNSNLDFTNDYSIECWAYISSKASGAAELFQINDSGTLKANIQFTSSSDYGFVYYIPGFRVFDGKAGGLGYAATNAGQWYHIAFTKQGTTYRFFIDGVLRESATGTPTETHTQVTIGSLGTSGYINPNAYLDEVRISNTARYTANFTPQTQPFVNDANTLLLLHMDGTDASTDFPDDNGVRGRVSVTAIGGAQIDTAQSYFGGASALFDGNKDAVACSPSITDQENLTIEGWFRPTNLSKGSFTYLCATRSLSNALPDGEFQLAMTSTGKIQFNYGLPGSPNTDLESSTSAVADNNWYHIAVTKSGSNWALYLDGVSIDTGTDGGQSITQDYLTVGDAPFLGGAFLSFEGNIDEFRISNTARYTANFTPSTTPFQNDDNTLLLLHMDGTDGSTVFLDDNGVPPNHDYGA